MYSYSPCPSPIKGTKPKETFGGDRYIYYLHCGDGIMGAYICVQTHQILYITCSFFLYQIRLRYTNYTSITSIKQYLQQNTAFIAFSEKIKSRRKKKQKRKRWKKRKQKDGEGKGKDEGRKCRKEKPYKESNYFQEISNNFKNHFKSFRGLKFQSYS